MEANGEKVGQEKERRLRGRPRVFDTDAALEAAMRVFWQKGYEGTSLSELTAIMNISRPSLYAAFGDKEALFRQVLERYSAGPASYVQAAMDAPTAYATVEHLLKGAVALLSDPENPAGCLITQGTLFGGLEADPARREVVLHRQKDEALLRARLDRAVSEGELPPNTNTSGVTRYFATVIRGLGISALSGASRDELLEVARMALRVWPER